MRKCVQCGGRLRRVHRTLLERFSYMAIYACKDCRNEECVPRRFRLHLGRQVRCPKCGTFRVVKLKERDKIDPMQTGLLNLMEHMAGGKLFHCRYCRTQFFDRRKRASEIAADEAAVQAEETAPPGSARPDV